MRSYILLKHHFINTRSLQHVSTLKGPSSGGTTDTFQQQGQQNQSPEVKLNKFKMVCFTHFVKRNCCTLSFYLLSLMLMLNFTFGDSFC